MLRTVLPPTLLYSSQNSGLVMSRRSFATLSRYRRALTFFTYTCFLPIRAPARPCFEPALVPRFERCSFLWRALPRDVPTIGRIRIMLAVMRLRTLERVMALEMSSRCSGSK